MNSGGTLLPIRAHFCMKVPSILNSSGKEDISLISLIGRRAATGERIARECLARLADDAPSQLRHFYRGHRAATRAKLYVWRATEPDGGVPGQWLETARAYMRLALGSSGAANR